MPNEVDNLAANPKLGLVGDELAISDRITVWCHPAAIVFGVGCTTGPNTLAESHVVQPGQDNGLSDSEMPGDLGGGKALLDVKPPNLLIIEEFREERDLNKISKIAGVRTVFGLVDHPCQ